MTDDDHEPLTDAWIQNYYANRVNMGEGQVLHWSEALAISTGNPGRVVMAVNGPHRAPIRPTADAAEFNKAAAAAARMVGADISTVR